MSALDAAFALLVTLAMFAQGLALEPRTLAETLRAPRALLLGLALNVLLLPAAALLALKTLVIPPALAAALLLCAAAPGGGTGGLLAASVRGDMALATALQVALAFSVILTPFWLAWGLPQASAGNDVIPIALRSVLYFQWLPLIAGLLLHRYRSGLADRIQPFVKTAANLLLLALIALLLWREGGNVFALGWRGLLTMGALTAVCVLPAALVSRIPPERASLVMVTVNRNLALALLLATVALEDSAVMLAILLYALVMYLFCLAYIGGVRILNPRPPA